MSRQVKTTFINNFLERFDTSIGKKKIEDLGERRPKTETLFCDLLNFIGKSKKNYILGDNTLNLTIMNEVFSYLTHHQIEYLCHHHEAVFTCEDAEKLTHDIPGLGAKNLFLRNKKKDRVFLVILGSDTKADLKKFGEIVGEKKLSFGSPELLMETLKITPGSVSVFCLIHDPNARVEVFIDQKMYEAPIVNFHPNDNTASLEITNEMFHKYLKTLPHQIEVVDL